MISISKLRLTEARIFVLGSHPGIIQAILDFDYLAGKTKPSIVGILSSGKSYERYFWGKGEILIETFDSWESIDTPMRNNVTMFISFASGRRTLITVRDAFDNLGNLICGSIFAEDVPEKHALEILELAKQKNVLLMGPASIGLLIPGILKLGAIGGTQAQQLVDSHLFVPGNIACFSASGGMTNEILRTLAVNNKRISFSLAFGGDRFPITSPSDAFMLAEKDPQTEHIVYFGELGGTDEYDVISLIKEKKITKPITAYIAGSIAEMFETPPQFGHAKAMAKKGEETAIGKRKALREAGVAVAKSFSEFVDLIRALPEAKNTDSKLTNELSDLNRRRRAQFVSTISGEYEGEVQLLGNSVSEYASKNSFAKAVVSLWLGRTINSKEMEDFVDLVFRLSIDHSPAVSGAVNTMVAARAGKDLVSSLAAGLLTIGPRFGGAVNDAARGWLDGVHDQQEAFYFVESFAKNRKKISGIGHRKYRIDNPDPRVIEIYKLSKNLKYQRFISFAASVADVTMRKKANLILNVDGAIAAVGLDILAEKEGFSYEELDKLVETEFFNALFVFPRAAGFIAHYFDQKRIDEGLFRLSPEDVRYLK